MSILDKQILITGASGSLGRQLLYNLHQHGHTPVAHVRESSDTSYIDSFKLEKRIADLRQPQQVERIVKGIDGIIHTAAWVSFRQDKLEQFIEINTVAAVNLFRAAQKAGVKRFVHVSTVAATAAIRCRSTHINGNVGAPRKVSEDDPFNLDHLHIPYIMTKHQAEVELLALAKEGTTELVIVNPSIIVAPSRTGDDRSKALRRFPRFIVPDMPNRLNLVDVRDVAPAVIAALEKGRKGERYILAGDNVTAHELVLIMSAILGRVPHLVRFPRPMLDFAARVAFILGKLGGKRKISFYPDLVRMLNYNWAYSSLKARRELGFQPRAVHITLDDLLTNSFHGTHMKPAS